MKGIIEVDLSKGCEYCPFADNEMCYCHAMRSKAKSYEELVEKYDTSKFEKEIPSWCPFNEGKVISDGKLFNTDWEGD